MWYEQVVRTSCLAEEDLEQYTVFGEEVQDVGLQKQTHCLVRYPYFLRVKIRFLNIWLAAVRSGTLRPNRVTPNKISYG